MTAPEMPEWVVEGTWQTPEHMARLEEALRIAWEALAVYSTAKGFSGERVWSLRDPAERAKEAMSRIEKLGEDGR